MSIQQEKFKAIADKIRNHLGSEELIAPNDFADKIDVIVEQKYSTGKQAGIEQGKQAQYDEFWDSYMNNLNGSWAQKGAFAGSGWNDNTFNPNKSFNPWTGKICEIFFKDSGISDLAGILKRNGVVFDFSGCVYFDNFAQASQIKYFPVIDMSSAARCQDTFRDCTKMISIEKWIISSKGNQAFSSTFYNCTALEDIVVEGVIGNSIDFRYSPLSKCSIMGKVITEEEYNALSDAVKTNNVITINGVHYYGGVIAALKSDATGKTLTLKKTAVENAFETSEGAADGSTSDEWTTLLGTKTNWTISLV